VKKVLSWNTGNAFLHLIFKNFPQVWAFGSCIPGMPTRLLEKLMKPPDVVLYNLQTSAAQVMINLPLAFSSQELICKFLIMVGVLGNFAIKLLSFCGGRSERQWQNPSCGILDYM